MNILDLISSQNNISHDEDPWAYIRRVKHLLSPQIYFLMDDSTEIVYIGKTNNIVSRLAAHINDKDKEFTSYCVIKCPSFFSLDDVESALISYFQPKLNSAGRGVAPKQKDYQIMAWFLNKYDDWFGDILMEGQEVEDEE